MKKNYLFYIILLLCIIAFCTGAFYETSVQGSIKTQLMGLLSDYYMEKDFSTLFNIFLHRAKDISIVWLILLLAPVLPIFAIFTPIFPVSKGLSLGFSATMIIENFGYKGIWYILLSILPQGLLPLPVICILTVLTIEFSLHTAKFYVQKSQRKRNKNALIKLSRHYILAFILGLIALLISCLIEVFLLQFLL